MLDVFNAIKEEIGFSFPDDEKFIKSDKFAIEGSTVFYRTPADVLRAALRIKAGLVQNGRYEEPNRFDDLCFLIDCSRNAVPTVETVKKIIRIVALLGYNAAMLYTEDTYEVNAEPVFGYMRGRYTKTELKEMDAYALKMGIELIPCIQTLAHFNGLRHWYKEYDAHFDCADILLIGDKRVEVLLENIFDTLSECFTSRRVHIGMDEAHDVGRGQYLDRNGYRPVFDTFTEHLNKVSDIASRHGFSCVMWGDMFCNIARRGNGGSYENLVIPPEVIARVPGNVEVAHWCYENGGDYYDEKFKLYADFGKPVWMSLSSYRCLGFLPMNGFSEKEFDTAFATMEKFPFVRKLINCAWADNGNECSVFSVLPSITGFVCKAYGLDKKTRDRLFYALTDTAYDDFLKLEYADTLCGTVTDDYAAYTKLFLYNDVLCGQFDAEVSPKYGECFSKAEKAAEALAESKYGYLFENVAVFIRALIPKYNLGVRVRKAYAANDKKAVESIISDIYRTVDAIKVFIGTLRRQWLKENKPQGFEIQELRLGGLKERLCGVALRLKDYADGKTNRIPELEEKVLPDIHLGRNKKTGRLEWSNFALTVSVNNL